MTEKPGQDRWSDQIPQTKALMARLENLPVALRNPLCQLVTTVVEAKTKTINLKTLPAEIRNPIVLGIWRSKRKQRKLDTSPAFYNLMSHLALLELSDRHRVMLNLERIIGQAESLAKSPNLSSSETEKQLQSILKSLPQALGWATPPEDSSGKKLTSQKDDMKVSHDKPLS